MSKGKTAVSSLRGMNQDEPSPILLTPGKEWIMLQEEVSQDNKEIFPKNQTRSRQTV